MIELDNLCGKGRKERSGRKGRRRQGSSLPDNEFVSKICKELLQLLNKKATYLIFKKTKLRIGISGKRYEW